MKDEDVNFPHILDQKNDPNTDEIKLIFDEKFIINLRTSILWLRKKLSS